MEDFGKAMEIIRFKTNDFEKLTLALSCLRFVAVHQNSELFDEMIKEIEFIKEAGEEFLK